VFLGIISNSGLNKYYTCYLGGVIVSINNKLIIDRDILSSKIRALFIIEFVLFLNIRKAGRNLFFLRR
jgi:hypothetical protein